MAGRDGRGNTSSTPGLSLICDGEPMARANRREPKAWTASQVVAHNLTRARELRQLTQTEVADRLSRFTGASWSQATVAQAEGSVAGQRIRQFTANELVALARTFDLPVLFFFLPPEDGPAGFSTPDSRASGWPWEYLLLLVWGHRANVGVVADRAAPWAHASPLVTVPKADVLDSTADGDLLEHLRRERDRLTPDDLMAVAFNGLARRRLRGAPVAGAELASFTASLRGLADALDAFNNYAPGTFLAEDDIRRLAQSKPTKDRTER
jgi:transcriptional regulator with XRE-family HTH domain